MAGQEYLNTNQIAGIKNYSWILQKERLAMLQSR